jgi:predicted AlkP superfamily phosphohydrolase/phosphomutase
MWEELSQQGYNVASINVPWTYPCRKVNGFVVAGYGIPDTQVQFTYPADLKKELLTNIPDYKVLANWEQSDDYSQEEFDDNMSRVERCFEQRVKTAKIINNKFAWDILMVQFQDVDLVQHHVWPYIGKNTRDNYPFERDRLFLAFKKLDQAIGSLLELVDDGQSAVVVVSDHGFGKMLGSIRANMLLYKWGYLKFKSSVSRMFRRLHRNLNPILDTEDGSVPIEIKTPVDWKHSKAMVMYAAMNGHIYLNVKGRNPYGTVSRGREYDGIIEDLRARFSQVTHPMTGENMFTHVLTPAELYNTDFEKVEKLGDLILVAKPGYIVHQSTTRKGDPIKLQPEDSLAGCHYWDGIYIIHGSEFKTGRDKPAHIVDLAPTIYAMLGAKLPAYLDGKVIHDVFSKQVKVEYLKSQKAESTGSLQEGLSEREQMLIHQRLSELGYMD